MSLSDHCVEKPDCKLGEEIKSLLDLGKYEEAEAIVKDCKYQEHIRSNSSDIIQMLGCMINVNTYENKYELFQCCETLIYLIAEAALPDDPLLELIELAEQSDYISFPVMLRAMRISLLRVIDKEQNALSWCLVTITRHINDLPQMKDLNLEEEECILLENTDDCIKMIDLYKEILQFLEPLIICVLSGLISDKEYSDCLRFTIVAFLIKLLGKPLICTDLESRKTKGEFRLIAERIITNVIKFKWELAHFLYYVSPYSLKNKRTIPDMVDIDFNNLSLGVFYYLVFKEKIGLNYTSIVYNPFFLLDKVSTISLDMLAVENSRAQNKGLLLLESTLPRISDSSLDLNSVNGGLFGKLSEVLSNVMIYSSAEKNRQIAVRIFKMLLIKFNSRGRYFILYNIQSKVSQPNFIGYIITITKHFAAEALEKRHPMDLEYFTGPNLTNILAKFCTLHKGAESDLIELSDPIIASLNFIRYLLMMDKENIAGISDYISKLEKDFLGPLKTGLSLSVAHYKLLKTDLKTNLSEKCNMTIGGIQLPSLSTDQKLSILETALTTLDLIQSLVARVEENLEDYKLALFK